MKSQKFAEWYEKYGRQMHKEFESRDEMNEYIDYKMARERGQNHEEAMAYAEIQAAKFARCPRIEKPESEADRKYRELRESCARTRVSNPNREDIR